MADKTVFAVPGRRIPMPRPVKRTVQIAIAVVLTAAAVFVLMAGNGMLLAKTSIMKTFPQWLAFVTRPDILATMVLTAMVTVAFVYWMRETERR